MFYGRAAELAEIESRLSAGARLITIIGPGGIGKTRVAQRIAETRPSVLCDLSAARDEGELAATLARALNIPLTPRGDPFDQLAEVLAAKKALLILDNCEQLLEALAAAIPRLKATVLATSRERLRISGEEIFELQPLQPEDAIALFVERARRQRAAPIDADVVSEIVESIDCIPLAVELAAARMGVLDAASLRDRLHRGIDVLEGRSRDRADRQRTMRATIDWSWSMLDEREQRALAALSVFRGPFDADAAEAVIGPHALDSLEILRDRSLVRTTDDGLGLYEPIRAYAMEKLEDDGAAQRHATYYATLSRQGRITEKHLTNLDVVIERGGDEALACAIAREPFVLLRGPLRPWLTTLDALLAKQRSARLLLARARARQLLGQVDGAIEDASAAHGDPSIAARAAWQLGSVASASGDLAKARTHYEEALRVLPGERTRFDRETEIMTLGNLGTVAREQGELIEARERYEEALSIARREGLLRLRGQYLGDLGALFHMAGDLAESSRNFEEAIAVLEEAGDQRLRGLFLGARALVVQEQGDLDAARALVDRALEVQRAVGDRRYSSYLLGCRAQIDHEAGREADAERDYRDAIAQCRDVKNTRIEGLFIACLGALLANTKRKREAVASFARAEELLRSVDDHVRLAAARVHAGQVLDEAGIRERLEEGREHAGHSDDVRFAIRLLERRVAAAGDALFVARDGSSFRAPSGALVDLSKKVSAKRILAALADARESSSGASLTTSALFEAGWPGERAKESSAHNRVYVALASLRTVGMRGLIESNDQGYRLDPRVPLKRDDTSV
jgi:predicted ATPase/Tfp pilus assembly protein PilF